MGKSKSDQVSSNRLALVAPVIRGLLANPTGEQDIPYEPIILKSLTSEKAVNFAGSAENAEAQDYPAPLKKGPNSPFFLRKISANN